MTVSGITTPADGGALPAATPLTTTRRSFLQGVAAMPAVAAVSVVVAAPALAGSNDELSQLMQAYLDARNEYERRVDVYSEFEREYGACGRNAPAGMNDQMIDWYAEVDEDGPMLDLFAYRPRNMEEARRRADFVLKEVPQLDDIGDGDSLIALLRSMSTEGVA